MRPPLGPLLVASATLLLAATAGAQVRPTPPPQTTPPATPARPPVDSAGKGKLPADSVPNPPAPNTSPPRTPTLAAPQPAGATVTVAPPPTVPVVRRDTASNPFADLNVQFRGSIESKLERTVNDRCGGGTALGFGCRSPFQPDFTLPFQIQSNGGVGDRVRVDLDYDTQREFDASNRISLQYVAKDARARLGRLEVGNVSFAAPVSRFLTAGIPSNNYGIQALGRMGAMRWRAIAAQQRANVTRDRVFTMGERASQQVDLSIADHEIEPRRFFWTIDPRTLPGYPNVDILDRAQLARLAQSLPDTLRPARVVVYRQLIGATYVNPRGPKLRVRGARNDTRQTYEVLREGVDYYLDPSQLWIALVRPLGLSNERLAVAYEIDRGGRRMRYVTTGGTPDVELTQAEQVANLVWEPELAPGDSAFAREMRNVYRAGGDELRRETLSVRVVAGEGDQEKPADASRGAMYLQLFGLSEATNPTTFDVQNRLWPRPNDPNVGASGGVIGGKLLHDYFIVFPSQRPFARNGGLRGTTNAANDTLYAYPSEFLFSERRPQAIYRMRLRYESESSGEAATIALGAIGIRPGSERLTALGRRLVRGVDYAVDYDLGTVTFLDPAGLFPTKTTVTAAYEENATFLAQPTTIFGMSGEVPVHAGTLFLTAISQARKSGALTRPTLGYEAVGSAVAGVGADLSWNAPFLARAAAKLTSWSRGARIAADSALPAARISLRGELAASKPIASRNQQAYLETFESGEGFALPIGEGFWYYGSRPATSGALTRAFGAPLSLDRASTMAWQGTIRSLDADSAFVYKLTEVDPAVQLSAGSGVTPDAPAMWLTLYPLSIGGFPTLPGSGAPPFRWQVPNAPRGRRWRSIRTVLNAGGADLSRVEDLEFYALVNDPRRPEGRRNPTLVFDFGEISENSVAFAPETLTVSRRAGGSSVDSTYGGKRPVGYDRLDTERDTLSRVYNAATQDVGLPGDRPDTLVVRNLVTGAPVQRVDSVPLCEATIAVRRPLGDPLSDCTVRNGRLDEEDIDQDGTLNLSSARSDAERIRRFVIDLSDSTAVTRVTNCDMRVPRGYGDVASPTTTAGRRCWVQVRVPFRSPSDSLGGFNDRRVRAARITMLSSAAERDDAATTVALSGIKLTGSPWLRRTDRAASGIAGDSLGTAGSFVIAGLVGTQDSTARVPYTPPPGTDQRADRVRSGVEATRVQVNEHSLRLQAGAPGRELAKYERAEAYVRFPEGAKNVMSYRQLRVWARGNGHGWGDAGDLQFFIRVGRDENNFYLYRTPIHAGVGVEAWEPEVRVDFARFQALRAAVQAQLVPGRGAVPNAYPCTGADAELIARSGLPRGLASRRVAACDGGYMVYTVDGNITPPNLAAVQELAVGMVRVDDAHRGADAIVPSDTLELWVDDVRLADAEDTPGVAGEIGVSLHLGDLADVRVNYSHRDPQFRQLGETPSFLGTGGTEIGASVRLDRLLPKSLGLALPLSVVHTSFDASPLFIAGTDLRGDAVGGLRAPREATTSWALTVRRATPASGPLAPILNNLALTSTYVTGSARSSYADDARHAFSLRADYDLAPGARVTLGGVRWTPTAVKLSSHLARADDRQRAFLTPVSTPLDSARDVTGLDHTWQQAATVEFRPTSAVTARWDASTVRDLRGSLGTRLGVDTSFDVAYRAERGWDGFERQRVVTGSVRWEPSSRRWARPTAGVQTTYAMTRDPNAPSLLAGDDLALAPNVFRTGPGVLPRRLGATELLDAGATLDLQRGLFGIRDSVTRAHASWFARAWQPVRVSASRTLTSSFDATTADPSLGVQLGLAGVGGLRAIDGRPATIAGVVDRVELTHALALPYGFTLTNHASGGPTRSWWRRAGTGALAEGSGALRVVPDVSLRWAWRPANPIVSNLSVEAGALRSWQSSVAPADSVSPEDRRATLLRRWPLSASLTWASLGGLTTSGRYEVGSRIDDVPGSRLDERQRDARAEATRAFKPPTRWGLKSDIRGRVAWQESHTRVLLDGRALTSDDVGAIGTVNPLLRVVQGDYGRRTFSFGANSDVAENLTLALNGTRLTTFNRNFGTQITQTVLSAALQINFFSGAGH